MTREQRYVAFKIKDLDSCLTSEQWGHLSKIIATVDDYRARLGKAPLSGVFVEGDWPEYEPTWQAIMARVKQEGWK